jgi:hypothetical protein
MDTGVDRAKTDEGAQTTADKRIDTGEALAKADDDGAQTATDKRFAPRADLAKADDEMKLKMKLTADDEMKRKDDDAMTLTHDD